MLAALCSLGGFVYCTLNYVEAAAWTSIGVLVGMLILLIIFYIAEY